MATLAAAHSEDEPQIAAFESLIKSEQLNQACAGLVAYTAAHPASWRAFYQLGYVYFRLHQFGPSVVMLSKSLAVNGNFADAHKILAFDLNIMGRQDLAVDELKKAVALQPGSYESHYELGRIYFERGSYLTSVKELETAKALNPEAVKTYHNLGLAYSGLGDNGKALENFLKGVDLNARQQHPSAWPLIDFGTYYNLQNEFGKAKELLTQAIQIDGRFERAYDELAKACRGLGEAKQAIDSLKHAIAIDPRHAEYHYALAQLYRQIGQLDSARSELNLYRELKQQTVAPK